MHHVHAVDIHRFGGHAPGVHANPSTISQQRTGSVLTLPSPRALFACAIFSTGAAKGLTLPTTSPTTGGALFTKSFRSSVGTTHTGVAAEFEDKQQLDNRCLQLLQQHFVS